MSQLNVNNITKYTGGEVVVNDASEDVDFRVESNGNTHAVFVDAGSDAVLIGKSGNNDTDAGVRHTTAGYTSIVCSSDTPLTVNRLTDDGAIINIQQASATIAQLETDGTSLEIKTAGNNAIIIDNTGAVTKPLQPSFLVNSSISQELANAGNETINFTTEIKDANADYDGTNTFTAPVTGLYTFSAQVVIDAGGSTSSDFQVARLKFVCSNRTAQMYNMELETGADDRAGVNASVTVDMDASDTCTVGVTFTRVSGTGVTNTIIDAATMYTFFSGYLVC